MVKLCKI